MDKVRTRAGSMHTYWVLTYHGESGPDSSTGGYDTPAEAREALDFERGKIRANPVTILDPARLVATQVTVIKTETDEDW